MANQSERYKAIEECIKAAEGAIQTCSAGDSANSCMTRIMRSLRDKLKQDACIAETPRYFLFSYEYPRGVGTISVEATDRRFPSNRELIDIMTKQTGFGEDDVIVTGWCEFNTEQDYQDFNNK